MMQPVTINGPKKHRAVYRCFNVWLTVPVCIIPSLCKQDLTWSIYLHSVAYLREQASFNYRVPQGSVADEPLPTSHKNNVQVSSLMPVTQVTPLPPYPILVWRETNSTLNKAAFSYFSGKFSNFQSVCMDRLSCKKCKK